jgi:hypothetical protein
MQIGTNNFVWGFYYFQLIFKTLKFTHRLKMICNSVRSSLVWTSWRCTRLHRRSGGEGGGFTRKSRTTGLYSTRILELKYMLHARTRLPASKKNALSTPRSCDFLRRLGGRPPGTSKLMIIDLPATDLASPRNFEQICWEFLFFSFFLTLKNQLSRKHNDGYLISYSRSMISPPTSFYIR